MECQKARGLTLIGIDRSLGPTAKCCVLIVIGGAGDSHFRDLSHFKFGHLLTLKEGEERIDHTSR